MTQNLRKVSFWLVILLTSLSAQPLFAQFPLSIEVSVFPPYPIRLADFTSAESNIFIRVNNPTQSTYSIYLSGVLRNEDNGLTISTDPNSGAGDCFDVPPGVRSISGSELVNMFEARRLVITGTSLDIIRGNQALPEGNYSLCLRAKDCTAPDKFLSAIPTEFGGCATFEVSYVEPPELSVPECGSTLDVTSGSVPISWFFIPPSGGMGTIQFRFQLIQLDPPDRNLNEAFASAPFIFEEEGIKITNFNLMVPDQVSLESGKSYAFRVVAYDDENKVQFRNHGESNVCSFQYGQASGTSEHPVITHEYPVDGDVIPFRSFPLIVKFDPFDSHYNQFISDVSLLTRGGVFDSSHHNMNWPHGPLTAQRNVTGFLDMTQEQSQYLPIYKTLTESPPPFSREDEYTWNTDVEIRRQTENITVPRVSSTFKVGMGPSKPNLPANGDTVASGLIKFRWKTADEPSRILPIFAITSASRTSVGPTFFNGTVDERWVIEISKAEGFDSIAQQMGGRLGATIDLFSSTDEVIAELYKDHEENFTIADSGRYYWRVKWMVSPDDIADNRSYAVSDVFSFVISGSGVPMGTGTLWLLIPPADAEVCATHQKLRTALPHPDWPLERASASENSPLR